MRDYLVKKGLPKTSIFIEPKATSTYENLLFSKQIMDEKGLVSSIIMTHKFHGSRSLDIAETIGLKIRLSHLRSQRCSSCLTMIQEKRWLTRSGTWTN